MCLSFEKWDSLCSAIDSPSHFFSFFCLTRGLLLLEVPEIGVSLGVKTHPSPSSSFLFSWGLSWNVYKKSRVCSRKRSFPGGWYFVSFAYFWCPGFLLALCSGLLLVGLGEPTTWGPGDRIHVDCVPGKRPHCCFLSPVLENSFGKNALGMLQMVGGFGPPCLVCSAQV